jgi:hypothetical protein
MHDQGEENQKDANDYIENISQDNIKKKGVAHNNYD